MAVETHFAIPSLLTILFQDILLSVLSLLVLAPNTATESAVITVPSHGAFRGKTRFAV